MPGLGRALSRLWRREEARPVGEGGPGRPDEAEGRGPHGAPGEGEEGARSGQGELPPLRPDWRDIVAFTIAMYQILAVPFLLFCGVALFIYLLLWLWAR